MATDLVMPLDPALVAQRPQGDAPVMLEPQAVEWMVLCVAHDPGMFRDAMELISPNHFAPAEEPLRVIFMAMRELSQTAGALSFQGLSLMVHRIYSRGETSLSPAQLDVMLRNDSTGLLHSIMYPVPAPSDGTLKLGKWLLSQFLHERTIVMPFKRMAFSGLVDIPENLTMFLEAIKSRQTRLCSMDTLPAVDIAPDIGSVLRTPDEFRSSGVDFIDTALGGHRIGDCNGLLGVTGGGKTTLALQMAVASARQAWSKSVTSGEKPRMSVFITLEEPVLKLRSRIWSMAFRIPRRKLDTMTDWSELTTPSTLADYERQSQGFNSGEDVLCEVQRYQQGQLWLRSAFVPLDLSGSDEFPDAGYGGVPELVAILERLRQQRGQEFYSIYLDYAGLLCDRYLKGNGGSDDRAYRRALASLADACHKQIAMRFQTTMWLIHQMSGREGKTAPGKLLHHADAEGTKDLATNMAVCACLGVPHPSTGCRWLNFSKVRYRSGEETEPVILKMDDQFSALENVSNRYVLDGQTRQFITLEDAHSIGGAAAASTRRQSVPQSSGPRGMRDTNVPYDPDVP